MPRRILTASLGLAIGALALSNDAHAIHLSTDGRGQVLIYPYYTVNGGNATLLSVVNTTPHFFLSSSFLSALKL